MKNSLIAQAAGILPVLLLSACAGGGSFDLDSVETKQHNPQSEAPKYQDEQTEKPAKPDEAQAAENDRPVYGFAAKIPRRNWHPKNKEDHKALSEADWEKLGAGEPGEFPQKNEIFAMDKGTLNESITTGDGKSRVEGYTDFQYVRSGYIYRNGANKIDFKNNIAFFGADGYLFYKGSNPSQALPMGKVGYKGTWDYVTDAKEKQKFPQLGNSQAGDRYGALSAEEADVLRNKSEAPEGHTDFGLTSEFEVDFAAKTMTGALYRNNRIPITKPKIKPNKLNVTTFRLTCTVTVSKVRRWLQIKILGTVIPSFLILIVWKVVSTGLRAMSWVASFWQTIRKCLPYSARNRKTVQKNHWLKPLWTLTASVRIL